MSRRIVAAALVVGLIGPAAAVELNPKAIAIKQADDIKWRDPTGAARRQAYGVPRHHPPARRAQACCCAARPAHSPISAPWRSCTRWCARR